MESANYRRSSSGPGSSCRPLSSSETVRPCKGREADSTLIQRKFHARFLVRRNAAAVEDSRLRDCGRSMTRRLRIAFLCAALAAAALPAHADDHPVTDRPRALEEIVVTAQ